MFAILSVVMKKYWLLVGVLVSAMLLAISIIWFYQVANAPSKDTSKKDFLITKGTAASEIGNKLLQEKLVKSSLAFKVYVVASGKAGKIQAGEYELSPSYSLFKIVDELTHGPKEIWVTIPEGLRREEIASKFASMLEKDENFTNEFLSLSKEKEGYLFPDTYLFPKAVGASVVLNKMLSTFDKKVDSQMREDIKNSGYSLGEILTLASLVEREAKSNDERPIIAGIMYNRLRIGMALQIDATVQYALASNKCQNLTNKCQNWWEPLSKDELTVKSAFNTYKYPGLPPGPIANPGIESIRSAIYPKDSDYLYYVHGKDGQVHYARTLDEHNQNVAKYLSK